jgi:hypothetical protein
MRTHRIFLGRLEECKDYVLGPLIALTIRSLTLLGLSGQPFSPSYLFHAFNVFHVQSLTFFESTPPSLLDDA